MAPVGSPVRWGERSPPELGAPGVWSALGPLLLLCACGAAPEQIAPESEQAPRVVETVPADGEIDVDAEIEQITATFSQSMQTEGWSWVTEAGRRAPVVTGFPYYIDDTTTVLPVRLEPKTSYVLWVNSPDDAELRKFASSDGVSAPAHRIRFTTR
jgi:Big-like domain-containing protein